MHGGAQPVELVRQRALVDLGRPARAPGRDAQRIGGDEAGERELARGGGIRDPLLLGARDDRLGPVALGAGVRLDGRVARSRRRDTPGHGSTQTSGRPAGAAAATTVERGARCRR